MRFSKTRGNLIDAAWLDDKPVLKSNKRSGAYFIDNKGREFLASAKDSTYRLAVETHGPLRTVIRAEGWYANAAGKQACMYVHR